MAASLRTKASDKQEICKKLVTLLKKRYRAPLPKREGPVLETMLYGICLENAPPEDADAAEERLMTVFHDLNEVRVSSVTEIQVAFSGLENPEWRALEVRSVLQYVFEKNFAFEFESLRRKTLDLAVKQLARIKNLSPFVRLYTLHTILGSHVVPLDDHMTNAAVWLGLVEPPITAEQASEALKPVVRKTDVPLFCHSLRCLANDPLVRKTFDAARRNVPEEGYDAAAAPERVADLFAQSEARAKKAAASRKTTKKKPAAKRAVAKGRDGAAKGSKPPGRKKTPATRTGLAKKK